MGFLKSPKFSDKEILGEISIKVVTCLFPAIFFYFLLEKISFSIINFHYGKELLYKIFTGHASLSEAALFNTMFLQFIMIFLNLIVILGLLLRRNLYKKPEDWQDVFIPLITTFNLIVLNSIPYLPSTGNVLFVPGALLPWTSLIGTIIEIIGLSITYIALYNLRYSFGIFVQVRDIVTKGLYRFVRHPIYLGYILDCLGFTIISCRLYYFIFFIISIFLYVYRACLEEKKLSQYSSEYREYMKKIPFLFPKINLFKAKARLCHAKAQVISEYAILFFLVIAVLTGMTAYLRRVLQARVWDARNTMMNTLANTYYSDPSNPSSYNMLYEYEPYYIQTSSVNANDSVSTDRLSAGGTTGVFNKEFTSTVTGQTLSQQLPPANAN